MCSKYQYNKACQSVSLKLPVTMLPITAGNKCIYVCQRQFENIITLTQGVFELQAEITDFTTI